MSSSTSASSANLSKMPAEVIDNVVARISKRTLLNFAATCRSMDKACAQLRTAILLDSADKKLKRFEARKDWGAYSRRHEMANFATLGTYRLCRRATDIEHSRVKRVVYGALAAPAMAAGISTTIGLLAGAYGLLAAPTLVLLIAKRDAEQTLMPLVAVLEIVSKIDDMTTSDARRARHEQRRVLRHYAKNTKQLLHSAPLGDELAVKLARQVSAFVTTMNDEKGLRMRHPEKAVEA